MIHGFDVYRMYLAMKLHFTNPNFDYFTAGGKTNAKEKTYQQRNDFWFYETLARKYKKEEIQELLLASFVISEDSSKVWIGDIKQSGKDRWVVWKKSQQSLAYTVEQDLESVASSMGSQGYTFNNLFETMGGHPPLLKLFLKRQLNLDTLVVMDIVLGFTKRWDKELKDPLWEQLSLKIKKYKPFLSINRDKYLKILREKFCG